MPHNKLKTTVLLFIDWFLPGTASGGPVRSLANMMNHMEDLLDFKVVTRNTDYVSSIPYPDVTSDAWNKLFPNVSIYYVSKGKETLSNFKEIIKNIDYDVAYVNGIYSPKYSILPLIALKGTDKKIIVGARGMLNPQAFSVKGRKKKFFITFARIFNLYKNIIFHATNEAEKQYIKDRVGNYNKIIVAPNFPRKAMKVYKRKIDKHPGEAKFVNIARISSEKGTLYMLKLVSKINSGELLLDIYGPIYDQEYWKKCLEIILGMPKNVTVNYQGAVDGDNIPDVLDNYQFFIMPSEGENFGHSIVEGLSAGLPVLISDKTPWTDLEEKKAGWDISLEKQQEFVKVIDHCLAMDQHEYKIWSNAAHDYAETILNDPRVMEANKNLFFQ